MPSFLLTVPVFSTLAGGLLALRLRSTLALLIAFSTGLLLGATFLDLLPEALVLQSAGGGRAVYIFALALLSFLAFLLAQALLRTALERFGRYSSGQTWGRIGSLMLIAHSFRDGVAIGVSYAASHPAGYIIASGIAAHDIGDGVNTILLSTRGREPGRTDYLLLAADAIAPLAGCLATAWIHFSAKGSAALLAITAGFFLHMIADELLPQLRKEQGSRLLLTATVLSGALFIYVATRLAAG